jgi:hypothetical protein
LRQFCAEINDVGLPLDIFIISDEPTERAQNRVPEIFVPDVECFDSGFHGSNYMFDRAVTGWDRALYFAEKTSYKRMWFVEDDVCFRDIRAFAILINKYLVEDSDLLSCNLKRYSEQKDWPHWHTADGYFPRGGVSKSFVPLCRLSRIVVERVGEIAKTHKKLCFIETMFSSICTSLRLRVTLFDENEAMIEWRPISISPQEVIELFQRNFLVVHPYKEIVGQDSYLAAYHHGTGNLGARTGTFIGRY